MSFPTDRTRWRDRVLMSGSSGMSDVRVAGSGSSGYSRTDYSVSVRGRQRTEDRKFTGYTDQQDLLDRPDIPPFQKQRLRRQDYGAPFYTWRQEYDEQVRWWEKVTTGGSITRTARIPMRGQSIQNVVPESSIWPTMLPLDTTELYGMGAAAIKACIPTNPVADVSTFIAELREGLPRLSRQYGNIRSAADSTASNYLAYEFGLKPMVSDVINLTKTLRDRRKIIDALAAESGKLLHRSYTFPIEKSVKLESTKLGSSSPQPATQVAPPQGTITTELISSKEVWFDGAFTYYFAPHPESAVDWTSFDKLIGVVPDFRTLWNILPYSWLADWFTNAGDIVSNAVAFGEDSLTMCYGYLMQKEVLTRRVTFSSAAGISIQNFSVVRKTRIPASPYGFGLTGADLSVRQLAILGALGITHTS